MLQSPCCCLRSCCWRCLAVAFDLAYFFVPTADWVPIDHAWYRLTMELDLQSFFGLLCINSCTYWLRPRNSPSLLPTCKRLVQLLLDCTIWLFVGDRKPWWGHHDGLQEDVRLFHQHHRKEVKNSCTFNFVNSWLTTPEVYIKGTLSVGPPTLTFNKHFKGTVAWDGFFASFNPIYRKVTKQGFQQFLGLV